MILFFHQAIVADNSTNVSISNCTAGPCPKCGGLGHIPDGVYNFIGDSIELLSGPQRSLNELKKLAYILETAKKRETNPQALKNEIKRSVPELSSISDLLPKTRSEFYNFIIMLSTVVTLCINQIQSNTNSKIEINNVINNIYLQSSKNSTVNISNKIGRNDKCPCGSGKKYKKCCLN